MNHQTLIKHCFRKKILLNKSLFKDLSSQELLQNCHHFPDSLLIINSDTFLFLEKETDWLEFDKQRFDLEKNHIQKMPSSLNDLNSASFLHSPSSLSPSSPHSSLSPISLYPLQIIESHQPQSKKYKVNDFTKIFAARYKFIENLLRNRQELTGILSINKILSKKERDNVSLIGMVSEINQTKNNNLVITVEDFTGQIKILINHNKPDLFSLAKDIVPDEIIGVIGANQNDFVFADNIVWPDIPVQNELKKHTEEIYSIFLSDLHIGSTEFLAEEFNKFLDWLNQKTGNSNQKALAQKVKYIFIAGDIVEGVGIYPGQENELTIKDIYQQFQTAADLLKKIPSHIQIILCPGNHEPLHLAEPQPAFNLKYTQSFTTLPNLTLVSNPALVNIAQAPGFPGFNVLLYHGYSFDYYVANVDSIRNQGGYHRADLIMKFLLKRRHLAPSFGSTPYYPSVEDALLIKTVPDFFITGHIHYSVAANYRGVTMICGSCWQAKTSFQEKLGHEPQPARVPLVNLKTREIKILKFI